MDSQNVPLGIPQAPAPMPQKAVHEHGAADLVLALLSLVLGFFFVHYIFYARAGIGATAFTFAAVFVAVFYMLVKKITPRAENLIILAAILVLSVSFTLYHNEYVTPMLIVILLFSYIYFVYSVFGCRAQDKIGDMLFFDLLNAVFVMPFVNFIEIFPALFMKNKSKTATKIGLIILGLFLAVIPTAIITGILLRSDSAFFNLFEHLFFKVFDNIGEYIYKIILAVPVAMFIFSLIYSCGIKDEKLQNTAERSHANRESMRFVPQIILCTMLTPICIVYIIFFISQCAYYTDAFSGLIPDGLKIADYARNGFFELCTVSFINLIIICAATLFAKKTETGKTTAVKIYTVIYSLFTLVLIATAVRKMVLYIEIFGLTQKRLLTTWFMVVLAVLFILIIVRQFLTRFNFVRVYAAIFAVLLALLVFSDIDALVARTNIDLYKSGEIETLDVNAINELGGSAVPYLSDISSDSSIDTNTRSMADMYLKIRNQSSIENHYYEYNISSARAQEILDSYN